MKRLHLICGLLLATLPCSAALADTLHFDFNFSGDTFSSSGVLTASTTSTAGEFLVTGITGTATTTKNGSPINITGILDPGTFPLPPLGTNAGNDNLLFYPAGSSDYFDVNGLSFELKNGALINLFFSSGELLERAGGKDVIQSADISIAQQTPEPTSLVLLGTGALGAVGVLRRRFAA